MVEVAPRRAPLAYAEAGVPHFWRVETQESGALALTVCTFELSAGRYVQSGEHTGRLAMTAPIPVDIELSHLAG